INARQSPMMAEKACVMAQTLALHAAIFGAQGKVKRYVSFAALGYSRVVANRGDHVARVIPDGWESLQASGPVQRELETLAVLAKGLPDGYTVYHSVHWTNVERRHAIYG